MTKILPYFFYLALGVLTVLCLRGQGSHSLYVLLALLFFGLACLHMPFRQRFLAALEKWKREKSFKSAFFLAGIPMLILALGNGRAITSYDNYGSLLTTASLVRDGTVEVSAVLGGKAAAEEQCKTSYWIMCLEKGVYSSYPAGMVPIMLPTFAVARLLGADLHNHRVLWRLAKWTASWTAALIIILFFLIALRAAPLTPVMWATAFLISGSALLSTVSQGPWTHDGVLLGLMFSLYLLLDKKVVTYQQAALLGLAWSFMLGGRLLCGVLIAPLCLWLFWRAPLKAIVAAAVTGLGLLPWFFYYWKVYGNALGPQYLLLHTVPGGFELKNFPEGFYGLLLSPCAGLFIYQPWVGLLFSYFRYGKKALLPKGWTVLCVALVASLLITMSLWFGWTGQACWGTRYLTEIIPVLALLILGPLTLITARKHFPNYLYAILLVGFLIQMNGTYGSGRFWIDFPLDKTQSGESRCLDWKDPAFLYPFHRWLFYRS